MIRALALTLALAAAACAPPAPPPGNPALPGVAPVDVAFTTQLRQAVAARGAAYRPRTRHFDPDGTPTFVNRLVLETSPYLLQHAHNPVNWFPWGDEAFDRARREGKPVFVSIGYSTCHWCHVMERESFEDVEIASFLNGNFIAVKVDREERPDVDNVYMAAVQAMTGRGGWPMTVVLTPDREPFFAGTYFPARDGDRGARKGFLSVLRELSSAWTGNREVLLAQAAKVSKVLAEASAPSPPGEVPGPDVIARAAAAASSSFDETWGGFGRAPKFPRPAMLELLLRHHRRSGDARSLAMVVTTLDRMAAGGMRDHLAGGFHRYSTDREWLVPHFEKMLYDNAQLASVYLDAWQATGEPRFADTARDTLDYVAREMTTPDGAFYSATDADSPSPSGEDEEGLFFTWTPAELAEVLGSDRTRVAAAWYGVDEAGNFEGRSILHRPRSEEDVAAALGRPVDELRTEAASIRTALYAARTKRVAPHRDDKVVSSWNGLTISAFARAALVLDDDGYLARAKAAARFLLDHLRRRDGTLQRTWMQGQARHDGVLDDYAFLVQALLDLAEADSGVPWLAEALALQKTMELEFRDAERGGYFLTSSKQQGLLVRDKPLYDGAEPSGNAVAIRNLLRLADLLPSDAMRARAEQDLAALAPELVRQPSSSPAVLAALDHELGPVLEVFVIEPNPGAADALMAAQRRVHLPNRVLLRVTEGKARDALAPLLPALEGKTAIAGQATAYVCERGLCKQPTSDPEVLAQQLTATGAKPLQPGD